MDTPQFEYIISRIENGSTLRLLKFSIPKFFTNWEYLGFKRGLGAVFELQTVFDQNMANFSTLQIQSIFRPVYSQNSNILRPRLDFSDNFSLNNLFCMYRVSLSKKI